MKVKHLYILLLLFGFHAASAQETKKEEKDSAKLYKDIEKFSKRSGFTKFLHGLIFEPIKVKKEIKKDVAKKKKRKAPQKKFRSYEGLIVRQITVETLDPFGYSEHDPEKKPENSLSRFGNRIHLKSKQLTIKNLLLFKRNRPLDSLLVRESERLIRSQRFVRAVVIKPELIDGNKDSVDVTIRVLDAWSLVPDISVSGSRGDFSATEKNFFGLGHQFENRYQKEFSTGNDAYSARYTVPNIMNTYIRTTLTYQINLEKDYNKSVNIERPFFSPFAKWAAGVFVGQDFRSDSLPDAALSYSRQFFKYNSFDVWGGHSVQIFRGNTENARTTNFISTVRYLDVDFTESPTRRYDTINFYSDEKFYLASIGISSRQFVQDKYIFNYGVVEDVPVGRAFAITGGWQEKNNNSRVYIGGRVSTGKFYKWGYLSSSFEYGTFFNHSVTEQSAFSIQGNFFTNLLESGKWKFRQFVKARVVVGNNRMPSQGDMLTLDDNSGMPGFNPQELFGTRKAVLTLQSQAYAPWNVWGFRLNPYLGFSMGMLTGPESNFGNSRVYSKIGIGFIISNDYLVFSSFQLSLSYFPTIPGAGDDIYKTNAFNTEDFGFMNFDISKPRPVDYQ
jgi:hypothetical protein